MDLTPLDAMTGSAEARYFGRGILPASIFLTSSCDIANSQQVLSNSFCSKLNVWVEPVWDDWAGA